MNPQEYARLDATALGELVNRGEVSTAEVAEAASLACELVNPMINAAAALYEDRLLSPGEITQVPFAGVPMLLKDTGATEAGRGQACGSRLGNKLVASEDAPLVHRYRRAGLNIIGRSTMPELAFAATTESALYGDTRNPWQLDYSTGGSSGGAAAAVAAGMVPIAHGTDTGGSIRIPAACCGLVGFKPGRGMISKGPLVDESLYAGINSEHVVTRTVRDTLLALQISLGGEPGDLFNLGQGLPPLQSKTAEKLRIRFSTATGTDSKIDADLREVVLDAARMLQGMGHDVNESDFEVNHEAWAIADDIVWRYSTLREARRLSSATGLPLTAETLEPPILEACQSASAITLDDWFHAQETYHEIRQQVAQFLTRCDVYLSPTLAQRTPPLGWLSSNQPIGYAEFMKRTTDFCPFTPVFNVSGGPAISLPLGTDGDGLPVGVQLGGAVGDDARILQLASEIEVAAPWSRRIPGVHVSTA